MGLTLVAILTAALLLPGIVAARYYYGAARTREVDPAIPLLSTPEGIALVGACSVAAHLLYATALAGVAALPDWTGLPLADPYRFFRGEDAAVASHRDAVALFAGLGWLCLLAAVLGRLAGAWALRRGDPAAFYGPLAGVLARGDGDDRLVAAYVLTKLERDGRVIGYQGTVETLIRDADRFPAKLVLRDASTFYLEFTPEGPRRRPIGPPIEWIALSADDWHNVAFRVFRIAED